MSRGSRGDEPMRFSTLSFGALGLVLVVAAIRPAPVVARVDVDQGEVCLECHDDLASELELPVEHRPAKEGECSSCHNPHAARDASLLLERPAILCVGCHGEIAEELARPVLHEPVAEGRCTDCHEPHGGRHAGLLVEAGADLCETCHEVIVEWRQLANQHSPFRTGRCAGCHEPHGSEYPKMATKDGGGICTTCHQATSKFRSVHGGYPVEQADCRQCHDPHSSQQAGLLQPRVHEPFAEGDCAMCHVASTATTPFALGSPQDQLCGDCHSEAVEENRSAAFPHVAAGGSNCSACHNAHAGQGGGLLQSRTNELCLSCHDPGGGASGLEGRFSSHGDLECVACHSPHGGDRPLLFAEDPNELCSSCHSHQHAITHPLGEGVLDPRNGQSMDCLSCHGLHEASHEKYLYRDGRRELCVGCHKTKGVIQ